MKKIIIVLASTLFGIQMAFGQMLYVEAPVNDNTGISVGLNRAPNGTALHAFFSACYLVLPSELTNIPSGTTLSSFGFTLANANGTPVSGNFTVYLQNTANTTYQKGTAFNTATVGMSSVYASVMTIPSSPALTTSVMVTLSSPFIYTGGGLYVAFDWASAGPFSAAAATVLGEINALPLPGGGGAYYMSSTNAGNAMTVTNSRPSFIFGFSNPFTNDIRVWGIECPGKIPAPFNTPHNIKAYIKNCGTSTQNNISVFLNVTGANLFTSTHIIPSLGAGQGTLVTFPPFNPQTLGLNTVSVNVAADQYNGNNSLTYLQSINCDTWALNPAVPGYTNGGAGFAAAPGGMLATGFFNVSASSLTGINFAISTDVANVTQQVYGVLIGSGNVIIATSNVITMTGGMLGTFQTFSFSPAVPLTPNTAYNLGVVQLNPNSVAFRPYGFKSSYYSPLPYFNSNITPVGLVALPQNFGYLGIEAVLGNVNSSLTIVSTPTAVCAGGCTTLSVPPSVTNGTWCIGSTGTTIVACPQPGNSCFFVGTNTMGCLVSASITIPVNALPLVSIASSANTLCIGNSITMSLNGAVNYSMNNVASAQSLTLSPSTNTTYSVTGIDANGCVNTASINVSVFSLSFTVSPNPSVCKGKSAVLTANPITYGYNWFDGIANFPFQSPTVTPTITTVYTVTATDANNCTLSNTVMVTVNPNPTVTASTNKATICKGESVKLTAFGADTYTWNGSTASSTVILSPISPTTYVVVGTTTAGCTHTATIIQLVASCNAINENNRDGYRDSNPVISIFPNPTNGVFNFSVENFEGVGTVLIYNMIGALVKRIDLTTENTVIDLSGESNGVYLVKMGENEKTIRVTKIIKQ